VRRAIAAILALTVTGCPRSEPRLRPTTVSQHGGVELQLAVPSKRERGAAIVLVDGIPVQSVVFESPGVIRARLPSLPRTGYVDVEVLFADDSTVHLPGALEVVAPKLNVRARD